MTTEAEKKTTRTQIFDHAEALLKDLDAYKEQTAGDFHLRYGFVDTITQATEELREIVTFRRNWER